MSSPPVLGPGPGGLGPQDSLGATFPSGVVCRGGGRLGRRRGGSAPVGLLPPSADPPRPKLPSTLSVGNSNCRQWGEIFLIDQERTEGRLKRIYGEAQTPLARVLASVEVKPQSKRRLDQEKSANSYSWRTAIPPPSPFVGLRYAPAFSRTGWGDDLQHLVAQKCPGLLAPRHRKGKVPS